MSGARGVFLVFRLPLLILLLLGLLSGLSYTGWHLLYSGRQADPAAKIQQRMQQKIAALESYHALYKTTPAGDDHEAAYCVEIWKEMPHRFRLEVTTYEAGQQISMEVIVGDHNRVYLYNPEDAEFMPAVNPDETGIDAASLEEYWRSISEAPSFIYLDEEIGSRHSYYQVEVVPAEPHRYRVSERIWLEKKTLLPVRIESFDLAGRLTQVTVFEVLQINPALEAALFEVDAAGSKEGLP